MRRSTRVRHERIVNESGLIGKTIVIEYECIRSRASLGKIEVRIVGVDYDVEWYPHFVLDRAIPMRKRGEVVLSRHLYAITAVDYHKACGRALLSVDRQAFEDMLDLTVRS